MNLSEDQILLERYLRGEMPEGELKAFEARLAENPALKDEKALLEDLMGGIRLRGQKELRRRLEKIHQDVRLQERGSLPRIRRVRTWLGVAATLLLLVAALFWWRSVAVPNEEALFSQYFQPYEWPVINRGLPAEVYDAASELYFSGRYQAFLDLAQERLALDDQAAKDQLAIGNAFLATRQYEEARQRFQLVAQNPLYKDEASWFLALTELRAGNLAEARRLLTDIAKQPDRFYAGRAAQLLQELN